MREERKRNPRRASASTSPGMGDRVALLRRTFGEEVRCPYCGGPETLHWSVSKTWLIALVKKVEIEFSGEGEITDWPEYPD